MSGKLCNGWFEGKVRFLVLFAGAVAAVVVFAWTSQARQDEIIRRNEKSVAVLEAKLDGFQRSLDRIEKAVGAKE